MDGDLTVKEALSQATIKLRNAVDQRTGVLAPIDPGRIQIDPVLSTYFGIDYPDAHMQSQIQTIQEFMGNRKADEVVRQLRKIENSMGSAAIGSRLDKMYRYVKLRMQSQQLKSQANALLK